MARLWRQKLAICLGIYVDICCMQTQENALKLKAMRRAIFFCKVTIMHSYLPYLSNNFEDFFKRPKPYMNFQNLICDYKFHVCSNLKTTFNGIWSYVFLFNLFLLNSCSQITPFSETTPEKHHMQAWTNLAHRYPVFGRTILYACSIGHTKNGHAKPKFIPNWDTTKSNAFCSLLPK